MKAKKIYLPKRKAVLFLCCAVIGASFGNGIATLGARTTKIETFEGVNTFEVACSPEHAKRYHTGKSIAECIVEKINQARSSIYIAMFSLTYPAIIDALMQAQQRGIAISVIIDYRSINHPYIAKLAQQIPDMYRGPKGRTFHHKYAVFDEKAIITGSANWTKNGNQKNRDHIVYIQSTKTAQAFIDEWKRCQQHNGVISYSKLGKNAKASI